MEPAAVQAGIAALDVPFYLHPRNPLTSWARIYALRLIGSGLFDRHWPFENVEHANKGFDAAAISENDRFKIGRVNAARLLKLPLGS